MASNLLELRRAAGYRNASDFAVAHDIPASTYSRYESNPDKIPIDRVWQLADIFGTTIDTIVDREKPEPATTRGEIQREYEELCPETRALADEFRAFLRDKDEKIKMRKRRDEERPYEALCHQYEMQMFSEMRKEAPFGEVVAFDSAEAARSAFKGYLEDQAAKKRGKLATKVQKIIDDNTIAKIMEAYDRTHGEFESDGMSIVWSTVDHGAAIEYDSEEFRKGGDGVK